LLFDLSALYSDVAANTDAGRAAHVAYFDFLVVNDSDGKKHTPGTAGRTHATKNPEIGAAQEHGWQEERQEERQEDQ
jgi:hypothetical protein